MNYIWDTTKHYSSYPAEIKKEYKKNYIKYLSTFSYWIDGISKYNKSNLDWWLSTAASRDERESDLYHNLCIFFTLKNNIHKFNINLIFVNSYILKRILIRNFGKSFLIKVKKSFFYQQKTFIKNIIFYLIQFIFIKINCSKNNLKINLFLVGTYVVNKKNYNFYSKFFYKKNKSYISPIFTNTTLKNFFLYIINSRKKKKIIFRENYLKFIDLFYVFFNSKNIISKKKIFFFNNINFFDIVFDEIKYNRYSRSVIQGYLNYFFFRRAKENDLNIIQSINSFENQIPDKGWNLGINKYYGNILNIGHQSASYHPQFQNLYPTDLELQSGVLPNKIYLTGRFFLKDRKEFCKKINFYLTKDFKFKKIRKVKKDIRILILLSGIKSHDVQLLDIVKNKYKYFKQNNIIVYFKFHPILDSKYIFKDINNFDCFKEIMGEGSSIIQRSKIVITSSFTAGLYESLIRGCYTLLCDLHPLDYKLYKKFDYITNFLFFYDSNSMIKILDLYINKKINIIKNNEVRLLKLKSFFFNN